VVPGDQLRIEMEVLRARRTHSKLHGRALVDGELAVEAILSSAIVER
jgi:3-hydroxymyristoyl/3-hydroxydecanoyl-(acyl carrier protein) dehydratase